MSLPWTAISARGMAALKRRPILTRVDSDVWVLYPPNNAETVRGGYPADTQEQAVRIAGPIAKRVWGVEPIVIDHLLVIEGAPKK